MRPQYSSACSKTESGQKESQGPARSENLGTRQPIIRCRLVVGSKSAASATTVVRAPVGTAAMVGAAVSSSVVSTVAVATVVTPVTAAVPTGTARDVAAMSAMVAVAAAP